MFVIGFVFVIVCDESDVVGEFAFYVGDAFRVRSRFVGFVGECFFSCCDVVFDVGYVEIDEFDDFFEMVMCCVKCFVFVFDVYEFVGGA